MLLTVVEGWAIAGFGVSLIGLGIIYMHVEKKVRAWFNERSHRKTRQLFIDAEHQYNNEQEHPSCPERRQP